MNGLRGWRSDIGVGTESNTEMINETIVEAIMGAIMAMITELTEDWIGD